MWTIHYKSVGPFWDEWCFGRESQRQTLLAICDYLRNSGTIFFVEWN